MGDLEPAGYEPILTYLCEDLECCSDGAPSVVCVLCGRGWPCADYVASHSSVQVEAQRRYSDRKRFGGESMVEHLARERALKEGDERLMLYSNSVLGFRHD